MKENLYNAVDVYFALFPSPMCGFLDVSWDSLDTAKMHEKVKYELRLETPDETRLTLFSPSDMHMWHTVLQRKDADGKNMPDLFNWRHGRYKDYQGVLFARTHPATTYLRAFKREWLGVLERREMHINSKAKDGTPAIDILISHGILFDSFAQQRTAETYDDVFVRGALEKVQRCSEVMRRMRNAHALVLEGFNVAEGYDDNTYNMLQGMLVGSEGEVLDLADALHDDASATLREITDILKKDGVGSKTVYHALEDIHSDEKETMPMKDDFDPFSDVKEVCFFDYRDVS
jgi:hypothetical protein